VKRYAFRLEQVLRVRRIQEDQAKAAVVGARRDVALAAEVVETRLAAYRGHQGVLGPVSQARFAADRAMHELRADAVDVAREREHHLAGVVEIRVGELSQAAQRVKGLERLDERRREDYAVELGRDTDREADDVITARFGLGGRR